ncbi:hypothetical protein PNP85_03305 [Halobacterium salinarum]|uniref:hypothetical protein n=1 Tax=Halobacterium salinarum TaxID=2242 RepID=UPI002552854E|nr:hypothetical protein [Halobacterium salinarum]MDL0135376.1 hypothetical protein [Halobacterium salinarum]MDL0138540.1 hypothetical protein [Halobacterium salinarum]
MSDPFDDLDETIEDQDGKSSDSESTTTASTSTAATEETTSDDGTDESMTTGEQVANEETDPYTTKAFEFGDEATQFPFYVRETTLDEWNTVDDVEVTPALVQDGVKDVTTSEKHDAMLQMVMDNPDVLVEYIKDARGIEADTDGLRDE